MGSEVDGRSQTTGSPGSVLAPMVFNIYTNHNFQTYLGSSLHMNFTMLLNHTPRNSRKNSQIPCKLVPTSTERHLNAHPSKTQVCPSHLKNHDAYKRLNIS